MVHRRFGALLGFLFAAAASWAGSDMARMRLAIARPFASTVVVPQARAFPVGRGGRVEITGVTVTVNVIEQVATTTMEIGLRNPARSRQEAELIVPVPNGAVVRGFSYRGASGEATARLLPQNEARRIYDSLVSRVRDPALLEFIGYNLVRSSVFPVEPRGTQRVRLVYENLLATEGSRVDYFLPRSESLDYHVPWDVSVTVRSRRAISTAYSPSHKLTVKRLGANALTVRVAPDATTEPGPFRLSYLIERNGVTASLFAYPDPKVGGGYFLLLAGLPADAPEGPGGRAIKREVTIVLDRSGSMAGEKIRQVRQAAAQIVAALEDGEAFNIIVYNEAVDLFSAAPVVKTAEVEMAARAYLKGVKARGGTNIHDALVQALRQRPAGEMLPIVLFLTDGLPTVGQTSEVAIRNVAMKANPHNRRIFTFGVGVDVNTPLLSRMASETRGTATFVLPGEDVELKVAGVFKSLQGPVLADARLQVVDPRGRPAFGRTHDIIPAKLPDLFEGDQIILLGQYVGGEPLGFVVSGNYLGAERAFRFSFDLDDATTSNAFVPRLWASRKIGVLIDAIRQMGANGAPATLAAASDPRMKELVDEIVRLSTEFGILTEYTAFLAREGTVISDEEGTRRIAKDNLRKRAMSVRSGWGALNQFKNKESQMEQQALNRRNRYLDEKMNRVSVTNVQQINDMAFYRRGKRWVDSRIVQQEGKAQPVKIVEFGTEEFRELVQKLAEQGRQGAVSLRGDVLMVVDGEPVLVKGPAETGDVPAARAKREAGQ